MAAPAATQYVTAAPTTQYVAAAPTTQVNICDLDPVIQRSMDVRVDKFEGSSCMHSLQFLDMIVLHRSWTREKDMYAVSLEKCSFLRAC
jgi:hypothetical protein